VLRNLKRRFGGKVETVVFGEEIKPGDRWLLHYEPPVKRGADKKRRKAK